MISFKHKFIFIHAPKTAGNAIQNVLQKYSDDEIINTSFKNGVMDKFGLNNFAGGKHATIGHYVRNWHDSYGKIEDYTISGCVRNPWDRATSYYFYLGNTELKCDKFQKSVNQLSPQTNYYTIDNVNKLNSAISYENLQTDFDKFCDTVGISKEKLPKANVSKKKTKHFMEYFDECPDVNEFVKSKFENDIKIFGY
tara:strand:+ start:63 stop:650 length:588 start_codon:yes stop_codon:yes gene_type:complete